MIITQQILDTLTAQAIVSPRLRMNLDLRNSQDDNSQRMLNAIEPGTVMPIHRHRTSTETVVCVRGHFEEYFYGDAGQWHSLKSLETSTVLLECKDGAWEPLGEEDVLL